MNQHGHKDNDKNEDNENKTPQARRRHRGHHRPASPRGVRVGNREFLDVTPRAAIDHVRSHVVHHLPFHPVGHQTQG